MGYCWRMAGPQEEIEALKSQVASLTARVYYLEQKSVSAPEAQQQAIPAEQLEQPAPPPSGKMLEPPSAPIVSRPLPAAPAALPRTSVQPSPLSQSGTTRGDTDLEKKIGQYWLNRIGIVAMLIGVCYFLKYAFDSNWVGPGGRVGIRLRRRVRGGLV